MSEMFESLQDLLLSQAPNYSDTLMKIGNLQLSLNGEELARSKAIERLILALRGLEDDRSGTADLSVLIRQVIRYYHRGLVVNPELWNLINSRCDEYGLSPGERMETGAVEVLAKDWKPAWLSGAERMDQLSQIRLGQNAIGDGLLYAMSRWESYQSEAQKIAVQSSLNMPFGSTLLITLPTGAGKSLCLLIPAWQESQGGTVKGGTTLVIVPTVSLAIDQEIQIDRRKFFEKAIDRQYSPISLTSSTDPTLIPTIRDGIRYGTLPILFTSPEKIMNSEFYDLCLEAARQGTLNRLVLDEAHLVGTWGAGFRTDFQFLSTYRRCLLEASKGSLRTVLLSGTITKSVEVLLRELFSEGDNFSSVRANRLRPEISYWFDRSLTSSIRKEHVLEAIRHLPRPLILYVTRPDDADDWVRILNQEGFIRVEAFSGKTEQDERLRIIKEWNSNQRDIMVANSAFGLGVDKGDVRSIIHATLPENIDRFYQEVGRGGRDGCSTISLICLAEGDEKLARGMTTAARISTEKAVARWRKMQETAIFENNRGDILWIDPTIRPRHLLDAEESQANQEWNEHTLLMMQRARLIKIETTRRQETNAIFSEQENHKPFLRVRLLDTVVANSNARLSETIEAIRKQELSEIHDSLAHMNRLVQYFATDKTDHCIAYEFVHLYPDTALACGGCPDCRRVDHPAYLSPVNIDLELNYPDTPKGDYLTGNLRALWSPHSPVNVFWDGDANFSKIKEQLLILSELVKLGCQQLILPMELVQDEAWIGELYKRLAEIPESIPHQIVALADILQVSDLPLYPLPTVVIYPTGHELADKLYHKLNTRFRQPIYRMNIIHRTLSLESLGGSFYDKVNGLPIALTALTNSIKTNQSLSSF